MTCGSICGVDHKIATLEFSSEGTSQRMRLDDVFSYSYVH